MVRLLPPVMFRFCEDDRERYGADWWTYDESALTRLPARELVAIEREIGMSLVQMMARYRAAHADAHLAASWVARRVAGVTEPFEEYEPLILLIEWSEVPDGDVDPPDPTSSPSPSEA